MKFHLTQKSGNVKTGPIPVSTTGRDSCPDSCPLKKGGCYAAGGPLGIHWAAVSSGSRGGSMASFAAQIRALPDGTLWRHNQSGDLPGVGDSIDCKGLRSLVASNQGKRGFTYTHKPVLGDAHLATSNRASVRWANANGFTINLSANTAAQADELADADCGPVCTLLPMGSPLTSETPKGRKVVVCPAQRDDLPDMTCERCQLCQKSTRSVIVGFLPHGMARKKANAIACSKA